MPPHNKTASSLRRPSVDSRLPHLIENFKRDVKAYLADADQNKTILASAWLISDNVIVDLFRRHGDFFPSVVAVDTLHLFPETLENIEAMEKKYNFKAHVYKPRNCETIEDFNRLYGTHEKLSHADFDQHSKIDPLQKAFEDLNKQVLITGRRADQGNERSTLAVWEEDKKTFNPLADWSWADVCEYVLKNEVPYNALHRRLSLADTHVYPTERDTSKELRHVDLDEPFFAYDDEWINAHAPHVYVWKSFGDTHTSIPVYSHESERAGRFVGRLQTECGIHTRIPEKGAPHGGKLIDLTVKNADASPLKKAKHTIELNERQMCDFELLSVGGFSPLTGFMTEAQYNSVVHDTRLPEGQLFGLPVTLDTDSEAIEVGDFVELVHSETGARGVLQVESKWVPDRLVEAEKVYYFTSEEHPAVFHLLREKKKYNIGGRVWAISLPKRSWVECKTPAQVRAEKPKGRNLVAFQSRNPLHRAHTSMFLQVFEEYDADVLVHPVIGPTKDDDISAYVRKQTYDALAKQLDHVKFEYLPYNMMVGGPREAIQHAIIRKNYGCTHMIVGRDHAGCKDKSGNDFYGPFDAQDLLLPLTKELGIDVIPFKAMAYCKEENRYMPAEDAEAKKYTIMNISGTKFRQMLVNGDEIPDWFAYPEVVSVLRQHYLSEAAA